MATLSGTVSGVGGAGLQRLVRVFKRSNGAFVGTTVSNSSTGAWSITTADTSEHFAIVHDAVGNPYIDNLVLGLHMNGTNGSTTFTDVSGNTVTALGNAQISTAWSAYGGASGLFDGSGDGLSVPDSSSLRFGTGDFSIRFHQRYNSLTGFQTLFSKGYSVAGGILIQTGNGDGKINVYQGVTPTLIVAETGSALSTGTDYFVEIERSGGTMTIRRNGTSVGSASNSTDFNATSIIYIGGGSVTGFNNYYYNGYLDDMQIYKGVSPIDHATPTEQFFDAISGGNENALIYDRLVPA